MQSEKGKSGGSLRETLSVSVSSSIPFSASPHSTPLESCRSTSAARIFTRTCYRTGLVVGAPVCLTRPPISGCGDGACVDLLGARTNRMLDEG
jgi:hypothetical protein